MSLPRLSFMTEEVARWILEVHVMSNATASNNWWIAFANPTAGPWKKVTGKWQGVETEVHRFGRADKRPDLLLVNDKLSMVLVLEAKDRISKITNDSLIKKSIGVYEDVAGILRDADENPAWGARAAYEYVLGYLWGNSQDSASEDATLIDLLSQKGYKRIVNFAIAKEDHEVEIRMFPSGFNQQEQNALLASMDMTTSPPQQRQMSFS